MTTAIEVTPEEPEDEELGEHEAAKAAGAAEVHQENAEEAAQEAATSADVAMGAAEAAIGSNSDAVVAAESAAARAEESAAAAENGAQAIAQAISAQSAVLESLLSKLEAPRVDETPTEEKPVKKTTDRPPAQKKRRGSWYYGK